MADLIERVKTGIPGLDVLLYGGIPRTNQVIMAGGPGSGKTLMCFEVLYHCAANGIPALFITFEERPEDVVRNARNAFPGFTDLDSLISSKKLVIVNSEEALSTMGTEQKSFSDTLNLVINEIEKAVTSSGAKFVALDSLSILRLLSTESTMLIYRRAILELMSTFRRLDVTALLTIELPSTERSDLRFSPEFFVFDGIIVMYEKLNDEKRVLTMEVVKMRLTRHSLLSAPYEVTPRGFRIFAVENNDI